MMGRPLEEARAAIERERETRHWTIAQWREAAASEGRDDWPAYSAEVTIAADEAVDVLLTQGRIIEAACDLYAEVEMAESVGICLPNRTPSLRLAAALAAGGETPCWEDA